METMSSRSTGPTKKCHKLLLEQMIRRMFWINADSPNWCIRQAIWALDSKIKCCRRLALLSNKVLKKDVLPRFLKLRKKFRTENCTKIWTIDLERLSQNVRREIVSRKSSKKWRKPMANLQTTSLMRRNKK